MAGTRLALGSGMTASRSVGCALAVAVLLAASTVAAEQAGTLATGAFSTLRMKLEKTVLRIDVLQIEVVVDEVTRARLQELVEGQRRSAERDGQIAAAVIAAGSARATMTFERNVSFARFSDAVRSDLGRAVSARLIDDATRDEIASGLPVRFGAIRKRGFKRGDRLVYGLSTRGVDTRLTSASGITLLVWTDRGAELSRAILASFLAPHAEFRAGLIRSLFQADRQRR